MNEKLKSVELSDSDLEKVVGGRAAAVDEFNSVFNNFYGMKSSFDASD